MRTEIEIETHDTKITKDEVDKLLILINSSGQIKGTGTIVRLPPKKIGEFASFDPAVWKILVDIANVSAIGITLRGLFDVFIEWQKTRTQKMIIRVGDISLEVPANASQEQISMLTKEVSKIANHLRRNLNNKKT